MKVLLCHNRYQHAGGEDQSYEAEAALLGSRGHEVLRFELDNAVIDKMARWDVAGRTLWNQRSYRKVRSLIQQERPAVMHCTNTFPLISPAVYYAAHREGVAVVQSLRNYRLLCPCANFLRSGKVCEDCLGRLIAWPGLKHGCYRQNRLATAVVAGMQTLHRVLGTWERAVDLYFAPSQFTRQKYIQAGFSADRIEVKPNFIDPDPGPGLGEGEYAIFVGRLSEEKGLDTLLEAWHLLGNRLPLKIVGDGPLMDQVRAAAGDHRGIELLGHRTASEVLDLIGHATCLVMPSRWYETFGRTIVEAFAKGTPAVVANLGAMAELVDPGRNGLHFEPGNAIDLANRINWLLEHPSVLRGMRGEARREFEERYTAELNYPMLMDIYGKALEVHGRRRRLATSPSQREQQGRECSAEEVPCESLAAQGATSSHDYQPSEHVLDSKAAAS